MSDLKGFTDWLLTNRFFLVLFFYILCIGDIGVVLWTLKIFEFMGVRFLVSASGIAPACSRIGLKTLWSVWTIRHG